MLIAIDEYPYLAASYPSISSMLQSHIDNCWKDSKLFFILCGSSMSYHSIISAIASGASKVNEIATKTGLETSGCSNQLSSLISLGIVCKEIPITEPESSRKTLYRLADSMYVFWYRFVRPNISSISRGVGEQIYSSVVIPQLSDFMGEVIEYASINENIRLVDFERMCEG